MRGDYFTIEIWKRKRLEFVVEKEQYRCVHYVMCSIHQEFIVGEGDCEVIIKHGYVSDDKSRRTIARVAFNATKDELPIVKRSLLSP